MNNQNTHKKNLQTSPYPTRSQQPPHAYTSYAQTYPKARPSSSTYYSASESVANSDVYKDNTEVQSDDEEYKDTLPVYAQVRKSHSDAIRRKSIKTVSENARQRVLKTDASPSDKQFIFCSQYKDHLTPLYKLIFHPKHYFTINNSQNITNLD